MRVAIRRKLLVSHFVAVVLVSGSVGTLFYRTAASALFDSLRARLRYSAALLSRSIDATTLDGVDAAEDAASPVYLSVLANLRDFQASNRDVAYIYVMRREAGRVLFVVDSDASPEQAMPGHEYPSPPPTLLRGFDEQSADDEVTSDRWGYFLSGYAPLKNGGGRYLVGIDMRADEVQQKFQAIRVAGLVSLALSVVLAYLFSAWLASRITRPIRLFVGRAGEIAGGVLAGRVEVRTGDELDDLGQAFNTMSDRLAASREQTDAALRGLEEARDQLEARVAERTATLTTTNERLKREVEERSRAEAALERAAATDYLTGLANRPALLRQLEHEVERFRRTGRVFSLLLADLDHFKPVNDTLGHEAGDRVLVRVAQLLRQVVRGQDVVCRWGGDELLAFLPETAAEGAAQLAERLRATVEAAELVPDAAGHRLTLSLGVATIAGDETAADCIRRADEALYRAKAEGRNRVAVGA